MPEAAKKKRTWLGLVCPVCRFVFRVPKNHDGQGVICPACNHLLNLPQSKKARKLVAPEQVSSEQPKTLIPKPRDKRETKPIVARPLNEEDKRPQPTPMPQKQRRGQRRKVKSDSLPEWEQKSSSGSGSGGSSIAWIVGGSILGLVIAAVGAWLVLDSLDKEKKSQPTPSSHLPALTVDDLEKDSVAELTPEEKKRQQEIRESVKTGMNVLTKAEVVVKKFLNASSLEEMAKYVRTPETTVPRMRAWYGDKPWKVTGVKEVGVGGRVTVKGAMASMSVKLKDFSYRQIALERVGQEYKVDWESWVCWSSMPWDDLFEKTPQDPVEIRVRCSLDSYYNRYFRDDTKWVAVRLSHPYKDRSLYGYIDKNSPVLMRLIGDLQSRKVSAVTIKVKYPQDPLANNQVIITDYTQNGWVRPPEDEESSD